MDNESKLRLLYIGKMLQDTDEAHPLTNAEIMQILEDKYWLMLKVNVSPSIPSRKIFAGNITCFYGHCMKTLN